ncbi:MAG: YgiT-type zinc finger protein [Anaerolineae bacterium]
MSYPCPNCAFGTLKPTRVTFVRRWGRRLITIPNFAAWQCDSCSYTRYDSAALAKVELIFGPDIEALMGLVPRTQSSAKGPAERGPQRWTY